MFSMQKFEFFLSVIVIMVLIKHIDARCPSNVNLVNGNITQWDTRTMGKYVCNSGFTRMGTGGTVRCTNNQWTFTTDCTECSSEDHIEQLGLYSEDEINFIFNTRAECQQQCTRDGCYDFMYYEIGGFCFLNFLIGPCRSISLSACRKACLENPSCKAIQRLGNQCFLYSKEFSRYTEQEASVATSCL